MRIRKHLFLAVAGACALSTAAFANTITPGQQAQPPDVLSLTILEPNSLALAGLGFIGFGLLLKRLRRQAR